MTVVLNWEKAATLVNGASRILILAHLSPDGDAIGSMLGIAHLLRARDKQIALAVDGGAPSSFDFLPGAVEINDNLKGMTAPELVIVADCSDERRIGDVGKAARAFNVPFINIDHHPTNTLFADANLVDSRTVATAELAVNWADQLGQSLNPDAAQALLCGIVTDTQCFRTNNVTAATLGTAQRLIAAGGSLSEVVQRTVNRIPAGALRLWAQVMPTICMDEGVIWVKITKEARAQAAYPEGRDGGLINLLLQSDEAHIACVLREEADAKIDVSIRAVPGFDVASVATKLGGGGHILAAGAKLAVSLAEAEAKVIPLLKEAAQQSAPAFK